MTVVQPVMGVRGFDWPALEAIATSVAAVATFGAVVLALYPVFAERARGRKLAVNLRARLAMEMTPLRQVLVRLAKRPAEWGPAALIRLEDAGGNPESIDRVLALIEQAHLLSPTEHDQLLALGLNLRLLRHVGGADGPTSADLLHLFDQTFDCLLKGGILLKNRIPELPWQGARATAFPSPTADVVMFATQNPDRVWVVNEGTASAFQVEYAVQDKPDPTPESERDEKLPLQELRPGEKRWLMAAFSMGCYPPFTVIINWRGPDSAAKYGRKVQVDLR